MPESKSCDNCRFYKQPQRCSLDCIDNDFGFWKPYIQPVWSRALCALMESNLISTLDALEYMDIVSGVKMPHMRDLVLNRINGLYLRRICGVRIEGYN
jgi:hypothetical protein